MAYNRKDGYYRLAKREGYRSRAAYKLQQIDARFDLIGKGRMVVDLGASPGGWSQVAVERAGEGFVVAADVQPIEPIPGVACVRMDVFDAGFVDKILGLGGPADVLLSDMAPDITGHYIMDHARSVHLAERVLELAASILRPGGRAVVKVFQGDMFEELLARYRTGFRRVRCFSPQASRKASSEIYIIAIGYRGAPKCPGGPIGSQAQADGMEDAEGGAGSESA